MTRSNRILAIKDDPLVYRREVSEKTIEVCMLANISYGEEACIVGRLMLTDKSGKISKIGVFDIIDEKEVIVLENIVSGGSSIAAYLTHTIKNIEAIDLLINYGDIVMLDGIKLNIEGIDIFLGEKISLLSKAIGDVYDKNIDFRKRSNLYSYRYLQLIQNPEMIANFRKCSLVFRVMRQFLYERGYEELNMTMLQDSIEAGIADPFVTHVNERNQDMFLRLTSEFFLRKLMIAGFSKIFEIGKSFRNQKASKDMLPQFTILELYNAYGTRENIESLIKDMICEILYQLYDNLSIPILEGDIDCSGIWPSYDFKEEIKKCTGIEYQESNSMEELVNLIDKAGIEHPLILNRNTIATALYSSVVSNIKGPAFLRNLPAAQSPIFKINDDGSTVDETVLVINGMIVADIVNPERDPSIIRKRMEEQSEYRKEEQKREINEDIINAMNFGLPPCRGIGMGIERFLMLILNTDMRNVELFPVF